MGTAIGSFGSAMGYYALAFVMVIWMVVKIARGSGLMALATFFIWPLAIISLIKNWGDPDTDIRIPFFAAVVALVLSVFMVGRGVDHAMIDMAPYFSEEELALIASENPEAYAQIMQARADFEAEAGEWEEDEWEEGEEDASPPSSRAASRPSVSSASVDTGAVLPVSTPTAPAAPLPSGRELEEQLAMAASGMSFRYASVELPVAHARLALPPRFRFIPALRLQQLARLRNQPLLPGSLGWITHDTVDLGQPDAWVIELRFVELGRSRLATAGEDLDAALQALAGAEALDGSGRRLGSEAFAPHWDAERTLLTWSLVDADGRAEHRAAAPLRHGALLFSIAGIEPEQREIGLRATRLLAASVQPQTEWAWQAPAERGAAAAGVNLLQWMQGLEPGPASGP
jgi:hypothetical protein